MPVPVRIDFIPPTASDITELRIYESAVQGGPFSLIEVVTAIGEYPNYISTYTTPNATDNDFWFAIDWFDSSGGNLGLSESIQGNQQHLLGEIVGRVMVRDSSINENIIHDEALAVMEAFFPAGTDVRQVQTTEASYQEQSGLTLLTQARCYLFAISEGEEEYTVGLVSQKLKNTRSLDFVQQLLRMAQNQLGLSYSTILQMTEVPVGAGSIASGQIDISRLLVEVL